jgi:acetyltransferase-like isoleucine patch superfamily enzyme
MQAVLRKVIRGLREPRYAYAALRSRLRGGIFKVWCRLFRRRVSIGRGLILEGKLKIRGPGRVIIGNNVIVGMLVTPFTYAPEAAIEIGDGVYLNGTRFGCKDRIRVGLRSILAECRIVDWDFHSTHPDHRHDAEYIGGAPITIEENVWITADCMILKGATIGCGSTIGPNSVCEATFLPTRSPVAILLLCMATRAEAGVDYLAPQYHESRMPIPRC